MKGEKVYINRLNFRFSKKWEKPKTTKSGDINHSNGFKLKNEFCGWRWEFGFEWWRWSWTREKLLQLTMSRSPTIFDKLVTVVKDVLNRRSGMSRDTFALSKSGVSSVVVAIGEPVTLPPKLPPKPPPKPPPELPPPSFPDPWLAWNGREDNLWLVCVRYSFSAPYSINCSYLSRVCCNNEALENTHLSQHIIMELCLCTWPFISLCISIIVSISVCIRAVVVASSYSQRTELFDSLCRNWNYMNVFHIMNYVNWIKYSCWWVLAMAIVKLLFFPFHFIFKIILSI